MVLLPFEPRRPTLAGFGLEFTLLETVAAAVMLALLVAHADRLPHVLAQRPLPLLCLSAYALVHAASAALAEEHRFEAGKFAVRMAAMAAFGWLVAAAPSPTRRVALRALVVAGALVALLAVAEGTGARWLDPALDRFREMRINVAGARRATAGSEYPNQAAAFIMAGMLAGVGVLGARAGAAAALGALLGAGLLFTYSRGALVAVSLALVVTTLALRRHGRPARASATALLVLFASFAAFAARGEVFRLRLGNEGTPGWYAARYEPERPPASLAPGERRTLLIRVTNTGRKTWLRNEAFHLSYHWYDTARRTLSDGGRTALPADLDPGAAVTLAALVVAPDRPGRYVLVWDMVHEETTWFSGQGVRVATAEVVVGSAAAPLAAVAPEPQQPPGWRPGRGELWRIAVSMWRAHPLLGVGPDNYRWLHGRYAGQTYWDTRVFANNTLLEAAATTGSLGALALALTYAAGLGAGYRRLRVATGSVEARQAAGVWAVLLGLSAHGAVDYVLAFTGHYLLLGLVIGSLAPGQGDDALERPDLA